MSDSPRKLDRRAHDALSQLEATLAKYPAAEGDLRSALGDDLFAQLQAATGAIAEAHARLSPMDRADASS